MRIAIVGSAGQLGRDLRIAAKRAGFPVHAFDRAALDVTDERAVDATLGDVEFDVLVNCAAFSDTAGAEADPASAFRVNASAPEILASAARDAGARFIHLSTDYVFDGTLGRPYTEEDPPAPLGIYGASKLTGEALARRAHPDGTLVVRTAALFGVAAVERGGNVVEAILRAARARAGGGDRPVRGVTDIVVSPTYTVDLAEGILLLLDAGAQPGVLHLVNEGAASWLDVARAVVEIAGIEVEVEPTTSSAYPSAFRRPACSVLDTSRAAGIIGPLPEWRDALERYLHERDGRE